MYCFNCGKEIPDDSAFCTFCGTKQDQGGVSNSSEGQVNGSIDKDEPFKSIENKLDAAGENFGKSVDDAMSGFKDEFIDAGDAVSEKANQLSNVVGSKAQDVKQNWRDYLTPQNMEKLVALSAFLPLFFGIVNIVIGGIFGAIADADLGFFSFIFGVLLFLIRSIFVITSAAALAAAVYIVATNPAKRSTWTYVALGGSALAFIACLCIAFRAPVVPFIFGLVCLIWGLDAFSRVVMKGNVIESTPNVSEDLKEYQIWYQNYKAQHPSGKEVEESRIANDPVASYFDGDGITLFGLTLLGSLLTVITCGIALPWMICKVYKWRISHTVINGRRLTFTGTGGSLFGHFLLWSLLSVITCGIYGFFMHVALKKWELEHTFYEDGSGAVGMFDGDSFQYFGYGVLTGLLLMITCGLAFPWTITMIQKWETGHSIVGGNRLQYEGTALGLLGQYIIIALLTFITCGIYSSWGIVRLNKYIIAHTRVAGMAIQTV